MTHEHPIIDGYIVNADISEKGGGISNHGKKRGELNNWPKKVGTLPNITYSLFPF